jgi:ketosteroid isomerase-like protein
MSAANKAVVRAFVEAVNAQDWPRVIDLLAPDFTRHSAAAGEPQVRSAKDLVAFLQAEFASFPDAKECLS